MENGSAAQASGGGEENGFLLVFDGPAHEQRISTAVPPGPVRWFCRSGEMGSDEFIEWWVTAELPPQDENIEITEYRLNVDAAPYTDNESGEMVVEFTCDDSKWMAAQSDVPPSMVAPDHPSIPRASFRAEDVAAVLVNGRWQEIPTPGVMAELLLEPDGEGPVKISAGPNIVYEDGDGSYIAISPHQVEGFKLRPSSVAQADPETTPDGTVRVARDTYDAGGTDITEAVDNANRVFVVEPNGQHTLVKDREGFVA